MDELKGWLLGMLSGLVANPAEIKITSTEDEQGALFFVSVHKEDIGKIIGKGGTISEALRTIVRSAGYLKDIKASLKIDSGYKSI